MGCGQWTTGSRSVRSLIDLAGLSEGRAAALSTASLDIRELDQAISRTSDYSSREHEFILALLTISRPFRPRREAPWISHCLPTAPISF